MELPEGMTLSNGRIEDGALVMELRITAPALIEKIVENVPEPMKSELRETLREAVAKETGRG